MDSVDHDILTFPMYATRVANILHTGGVAKWAGVHADDGLVICSDRVVRLIRKVHPPLAQRIRAQCGGHAGLG